MPGKRKEIERPPPPPPSSTDEEDSSGEDEKWFDDESHCKADYPRSMGPFDSMPSIFELMKPVNSTDLPSELLDHMYKWCPPVDEAKLKQAESRWRAKELELKSKHPLVIEIATKQFLDTLLH